MSISEPSTLLTDYLLAVVALVLGARLALASFRSDSMAQALWAVAFCLGAAAAVAGGSVHGFRFVLAPLTLAVLWQYALLGSALAGALLLAGAALHALRGRVRLLALAFLTAKAVVEMLVIGRAGLTADAAWAAATTIVLLLGLTLLGARTDRAPLGWVLLGLLLSAAGLVAQAGRLALHPHFNHNDLFHVLVTAGLWPFYRAGLRLRPDTPTSERESTRNTRYRHRREGRCAAPEPGP